jgi:hypothetical protein
MGMTRPGFQEMSAIVMTLAQGLALAVYVGVIAQALSAGARLADIPPHILVVLVIVSVLIAAIGHALAAIISPSEANAPRDERERAIAGQAARVGSTVTFLAMSLVLVSAFLGAQGWTFFHLSVVALSLGGLSETLASLWLFRRDAH